MVQLSNEQQMLVDSVREIAENEFKEDTFKDEGEVPWENVQILADSGFLGVNLDEEYGGGGMTEFEAMILTETVGRVSPKTGAYLGEQQMVAPRAIDMFGTPEAKEKYLPKVVNGETGIAIAISEPEAGSDVQSMNTTVEEEDDGELVLNGEKIWVSRVLEYEAAVVWVKFPGEGLGSVILDLDSAGVEIAQEFTNMVGDVQVQMFFEDVTIPQENILTRGQDGFKEQLKALNWERLGSATMLNAVNMCATEQALEYAEQRKQFGQKIGDFQGIEWKLADMVKKTKAARSITHLAAHQAIEQGRVPSVVETSVAKLFASEVGEEIISEALQVHGANGYQQGHLMEYLYRWMRGHRIAGGTDEILKNTIARRIKSKGLRWNY